MMQRAGGNSSSGITKAKVVEQLAPAGRRAAPRLWASFWENAEQVGPHYLWRGERLAGLPVFTSNSAALPASVVAWAYDGRELEPGHRLVPFCNRKGCVRPEHQAVLRGEQ